MKTYPSAHQAAMAHAGAHKSRVGNCLTYTDGLIRQRAIRPVLNGRRQITHWIIVGPKDWWIVRTKAGGTPEVVKGPFKTKLNAMHVSGYSISKKLYGGCYEVAHDADKWTSLVIVTTEFAAGMGLNP